MIVFLKQLTFYTKQKNLKATHTHNKYVHYGKKKKLKPFARSVKLCLFIIREVN